MKNIIKKDIKFPSISYDVKNYNSLVIWMHNIQKLIHLNIPKWWW
jgi:hypothetical protein